MGDAFPALDSALPTLTASLRFKPTFSAQLPDTNAVAAFTTLLKQLLFPAYDAADATARHTLVADIAHLLAQQIAIVLPCADASALTLRFLEQLPEIHALLLTDLAAFFDSDPAATSPDEIILAYPGWQAILIHRLAHALHVLGVPMLPRIMSEHAHSASGIDIHPGASIGDAFFIDHGTGVVIGETTVIGSHVKLYQGVTLGALSTRNGQGLRGKRRHPTIEDRVTIYAGASVLGGDTVIGHDSVIGGNAFITASVAPGMRVSVRHQELEMRPGRQSW